MKHYFMVLAFLGLNFGASAADLSGSKMQPVREYSDVSSGTWSGVYIGAHAGYGFNNHDINEQKTETKPASCKNGAVMHNDGKCYVKKPCRQNFNGCEAESPESYVAAVTTVTNILTSIEPDGILGGIRVGMDYQPLRSRLVFGLFGDFNFADNDEVIDNSVISDQNSYLVAGRLGALLNDKTLVYGLFGYGWQDVSYSNSKLDTTIDKTFGHMVAGAGLEYKITENLTAGIEGQHWFETKKTIYTDSYVNVTDERSDTRILARLNYRFDLK